MKDTRFSETSKVAREAFRRADTYKKEERRVIKTTRIFINGEMWIDYAMSYIVA